MELKNIHIGKLVESAFNQSEISKSQLSKAIGIYKQNLKREFENSDWSVIKLINAGKILNHDFSYLFTLESEKESQKTKVILQIEVEDEKINDVLKVIANKNLYKILKQ
jgi:hypothetical protein